MATNLSAKVWRPRWDSNPRSNLEGSPSGPSNPLSKRDEGMQTRVLRPDVSVEGAEQQGREQRSPLAARECGCPFYIKSCVHFDGKLLQLGEQHEPHGLVPGTLYDVALLPDVATNPCACHGHPVYWDMLSHGQFARTLCATDDHDEALAAFYAAAARLLGRAE